MKTRSIKIIPLLLSFLLLVSCQDSRSPSREQIEKVKEVAKQASTSLYVPSGVTLITEKSMSSTGSHLHPGCVYVTYYMIYESEKPFDEIIADYRKNIAMTGWEPHPGMKHEGDRFDFFRKSSQTFLEITDLPVRDDLLPAPTLNNGDTKKTIYYVLLAYYDPSEEVCAG